MRNGPFRFSLIHIVARVFVPLDQRSKLTRALGATISGVRHRCRLRSETGWAEFGYFFCYFKMVAPRALFIRNGGSGNEIVPNPLVFPSPSPLSLLKVPKHRGKTIAKHVTLLYYCIVITSLTFM